MAHIYHSVIALAETLEGRWKSYRDSGDCDLFVEFTVSLNGLTEQLSRQHLPGLVRACQELETAALALFGDRSMHPLPVDQANGIERKLGIILAELRRHETPGTQTRRQTDFPDSNEDPWNRPREVLIVSRARHPWSTALSEQLSFFGFAPAGIRWEDEPSCEEPPLAILYFLHHCESSRQLAKASWPKTLILIDRNIRSRIKKFKINPDLVPRDFIARYPLFHLAANWLNCAKKIF